MSDLKQAVERLGRDMEDVCQCGGTLLEAADLRLVLSALSRAEAERDLLVAECRAVRAEGRKQGLDEAAAWHDAQAYAAECADDTMQGVRNGEPHRKAAAAIRALKESK